MSRPATGQVVVRRGTRGTSYALRFRAGGRRQYVTLGTAEEGWSPARAEAELANVLADVRRGIWRPPAPPLATELPAEEPTFHAFRRRQLPRGGFGGVSLRGPRSGEVVHLAPGAVHVAFVPALVRGDIGEETDVWAYAVDATGKRAMSGPIDLTFFQRAPAVGTVISIPDEEEAPAERMGTDGH